jgi:hypothetical protein
MQGRLMMCFDVASGSKFGEAEGITFRFNSASHSPSASSLQHCLKTFWIVRLILPLPAQDE